MNPHCLPNFYCCRCSQEGGAAAGRSRNDGVSNAAPRSRRVAGAIRVVSAERWGLRGKRFVCSTRRRRPFFNQAEAQTTTATNGKLKRRRVIMISCAPKVFPGGGNRQTAQSLLAHHGLISLRPRLLLFSFFFICFSTSVCL